MKYQRTLATVLYTTSKEVVMAYGFSTFEEALKHADELAAKFPENRYEVDLHKRPERSMYRMHLDMTVTYGVKCYVPYCENMPERLIGYVWF